MASLVLDCGSFSSLEEPNVQLSLFSHENQFITVRHTDAYKLLILMPPERGPVSKSSKHLRESQMGEDL